ncbi:MAG: iron complex outermembrane receptor protein, partial [Vicingaceae bacterium]
MKYYFLMLAAICWSHTVFAQFSITGTVYDQNKLTLPGASVVLKDTERGVSTQADGTFTIEVPLSSATLVVSFLGYET